MKLDFKYLNRSRRAATARPAPHRPGPASVPVDPDAEIQDGRTPAAAARQRERARCAAIMQSQAGLENPAAAAALAFTTNMPRAAAIAALEILAPNAASATDARRGWTKAFSRAGGTEQPAGDRGAAANWRRAFAAVGT